MGQRKKIKQNGSGFLGIGEAAKFVYGALRMAAKNARTLRPGNIFRQTTMNRFGIPKSLARKMYHIEDTRTFIPSQKTQQRRTTSAVASARRANKKVYAIKISQMNSDIRKYGRGSNKLWKYGIYS